MVKKKYYDAIRELFFDFPNKAFGIREIARFVKLSHPSVIRYLSVLEKEGIIKKTDSGLLASKNQQYKQMKKIALIERIHALRLVEHIQERCMPNVIILFGSAARGEDEEQSDIDIFVESKEKPLVLNHFEKKLKRKINITFGIIKRLNKDFLESVINGMILFGGIHL